MLARLLGSWMTLLSLRSRVRRLLSEPIEDGSSLIELPIQVQSDGKNDQCYQTWACPLTLGVWLIVTHPSNWVSEGAADPRWNLAESLKGFSPHSESGKTHGGWILTVSSVLRFDFGKVLPAVTPAFLCPLEERQVCSHEDPKPLGWDTSFVSDVRDETKSSFFM